MAKLITYIAPVLQATIGPEDVEEGTLYQTRSGYLYFAVTASWGFYVRDNGQISSVFNKEAAGHLFPMRRAPVGTTLTITQEHDDDLSS